MDALEVVWGLMGRKFRRCGFLVLDWVILEEIGG